MICNVICCRTTRQGFDKGQINDVDMYDTVFGSGAGLTDNVSSSGRGVLLPSFSDENVGVTVDVNFDADVNVDGLGVINKEERAVDDVMCVGIVVLIGNFTGARRQE